MLAAEFDLSKQTNSCLGHESVFTFNISNFNISHSFFFNVLLRDNALHGNAVLLINILHISTCKDWLLQSVVSIIGVPLSVGWSDEVVIHVHVQSLRLGEEYRHQDALQNNKRPQCSARPESEMRVDAVCVGALTSARLALSIMSRSFWGLTLLKKTSKECWVATMLWKRETLFWQV